MTYLSAIKFSLIRSLYKILIKIIFFTPSFSVKKYNTLYSEISHVIDNVNMRYGLVKKLSIERSKLL